MGTFHENLLLAGNEITAVTELMEEGQQADKRVDYRLGGPYTKTYSDGHRVTINVLNMHPPSIVAELINQRGAVVDRRVSEAPPLDKSYSFTDGSDMFTLHVLRSASEVLRPDEISVYLENNGSKCPYCGDTELHKRLVHDEAVLRRKTRCCACLAEWMEYYSMNNITEISPPSANTATPPES